MSVPRHKLFSDVPYEITSRYSIAEKADTVRSYYECNGDKRCNRVRHEEYPDRVYSNEACTNLLKNFENLHCLENV